VETTNRKSIAALAAGLGLALLFMGALRYSAAHPTVLSPLAGYATPGYIALTALFVVLLVRAGSKLELQGFGLF
jgi:hypothetical protein